MGEIIAFPVDNSQRIRQAIQYYRNHELTQAAQAFAVARQHAETLAEFQDGVIAEFLDQQMVSEAQHLVDEILYTTEDVERVFMLIEQFDEVLPMDLDQPLTIPPVLPQALLAILLGSFAETEDHQQLFEHLEQIAKTMAKQPILAQMRFVQRVRELAPKPQVALIKLALEQPKMNFLVRCDLLHLLLALDHEDTLLRLVDDTGQEHTLRLNDLVPLDESRYYQRGSAYLSELSLKDPIAEQALAGEWLLFCSFLFPFLDIERFLPETVIDFLQQLLTVGEEDMWQVINAEDQTTQALLRIHYLMNKEMPMGEE